MASLTPRSRAGLLVALGLFLAIVFVAANSVVVVPGEQVEPTTNTSDVRLAAPEDADNRYIWPFTSRSRSFDTLTLPVNVVVMADAETTTRYLATAAAASDGADWDRGGDDDEVHVTGTGIEWNETEGATRYSYVKTPNGGGWVDETTQLHDGTYFGSRYHLRLYQVGSGDRAWTAIQAHHEHWDWFRLRHTVDSVSQGRHHVETDFYGTGLLDQPATRERFGNGGLADGDGWVTVLHVGSGAEADVTLDEADGPDDAAGGDGAGADRSAYAVAAGVLAVLLLAGTTGAHSLADRLRRAAHVTQTGLAAAALFASLAVLPPGVRLASLWLEQSTALGAHPKVIAGLLYPVLAGGAPILAVALGRYVPAEEAFAAAAVGLGTGLLFDYQFVGITAVPVDVLVHRVVLLVAVGLLAAGGTRWADAAAYRHVLRAAGVVLWVAALAWPLV